MTEEDIIFDKREIPEISQEQKERFQKLVKNKKDMRKYWEKQHLSRGALSVLKPLIEKVNKMKKDNEFKNDSQVVEYLLDLEEDIKKHNLIKETKTCEKCGVLINIKLDSYKGITHRHIDAKSNCMGCIKTKYGIIDNIDQEEQDNDESNEQNQKLNKEQDKVKTVDDIFSD